MIKITPRKSYRRSRNPTTCGINIFPNPLPAIEKLTALLFFVVKYEVTITITVFVAHPKPMPTRMQYESKMCHIDVVNAVMIKPILTDMHAIIATFRGENVLIKIVVNNPDKFRNKLVTFITNAISFFDICIEQENKGPKRRLKTDISD